MSVFSRVEGDATLLTVDEPFAEQVRARKVLETPWLQAQKMEVFGQLAGGVAHDFNNLLTVIIGCGELLMRALRPDDPAREFARDIQAAAEKAASLTRQLLTFSRKQAFAPRTLDLNKVVSAMEEMLRRIIGEDIQLATSLSPFLGVVRADPAQIEQVLLNLAVNARDAMPKGGKLLIETRNLQVGDENLAIGPGTYATLTVSDTGCGMSPEVQRRIFEPFFTTKGGKGTGLGLATVHGIIQQSGGHVEVQSEPGAGSSFRIYLPLLGETIGSEQSAASVPHATRGSETVLLVEDDDQVRALGRQVLESSGYRVLLAGNATEAIHACERHKGAIDLLLTDVVMPGMAGPELAEHLRALRAPMKVLFLSGYGEDAVGRHGLLEDPANFLQKPFTPRALAAKVRDVLDATPISPSITLR